MVLTVDKYNKQEANTLPLDHNCAFHAIIPPFIDALRKGALTKEILKQRNYQHLLALLKKAYGNRVSWNSIKHFVENEENPIIHELFFGPIFREFLGDILEKNDTHKNNLKDALYPITVFDYLYNHIPDATASSLLTPANKGIFNLWKNKKPNEEELAVEMDKNWPQVYENYCHHIKTSTCYISFEEIAELAKGLQIPIEGYQHICENPNNPKTIKILPTISIEVPNPIGDPFQLVLRNNHWTYIESSQKEAEKHNHYYQDYNKKRTPLMNVFQHNQNLNQNVKQQKEEDRFELSVTNSYAEIQTLLDETPVKDPCTFIGIEMKKLQKFNDINIPNANSKEERLSFEFALRLQIQELKKYQFWQTQQEQAKQPIESKQQKYQPTKDQSTKYQSIKCY